MKEKKELLNQMAAAVLEMEEDAAAEISQAYIDCGFDALEGITEGLAPGMNRAGELYEEEEYFVPELLLCSDAMYEGIHVLRPHVHQAEGSGDHKLTAVVGVVEGDTHDIGKNLFKIMLETLGFEVCDLGRDVPVDTFIDKARELQADLVGMSTLMTTTLGNMQIVIDKLKTAGIRDNLVVMVGGGPVSPEFAKRIGADGYERDASSAAKTAKALVLSLHEAHDSRPLHF